VKKIVTGHLHSPRRLPLSTFHRHRHHHRHFQSGLNSKDYCKDHCSGGEIMTRQRKCQPKSNSFVAAAEQICLHPVLEHRQRRGRRDIAEQAIPYLRSSNRKGTTSDMPLFRLLLGLRSIARPRRRRFEAFTTDAEIIRSTLFLTAAER